MAINAPGVGPAGFHATQVRQRGAVAVDRRGGYRANESAP